jgi:hypothetical protein
MQTLRLFCITFPAVSGRAPLKPNSFVPFLFSFDVVVGLERKFLGSFFLKENHFSLVVATSIEYETDYCLRCGDYAELCNLSAVTRTVKNTLRLYFFPSSSLTAL